MAVLDGSESVLCVPAATLARLPAGYLPAEDTWPGNGCPAWHVDGDAVLTLKSILMRAEFVPRTEALEHGDEGLAWCQVVPYSVVHCNGRVLAYRRPREAGDRRLRGRYSLGLGGHVNPRDMGFGVHAEELDIPVVRELQEEVGLLVTMIESIRLAGLIRDASDDVGRRHVGLVHAVEVVASAAPHVRHSAEVDWFGWVAPARIWDVFASDEWESWSALLVPHLGAIVGEGANLS